ncbi:MAG: hypothetical protein WKF92_07590 [Pyrinomonadaceae bacterium]
MTNADIIEMVKSGLSEGIILAKIKNSKYEFDTSSPSLVKLKDSGVSETLIMAVIERQDGSTTIDQSAKARVEESDKRVIEMNNAVGKRNVFIRIDDDESRLEFSKRLSDKKFVIVNERDNAELVFEFTIEEGTAQSRSGIYRGVEASRKTRTGKLVVTVVDGNKKGIIFAREFEPNSTFAFAGNGVPPRVRDQIKWFFMPEFIKQMNKAGDRIK